LRSDLARLVFLGRGSQTTTKRRLTRR
jgi:hypothetical protein